MHFRLFAGEFGQYTAEAQRLLAKLRPHPVLPGSRRITLIEDEVDDRQHRGEAHLELGSARHFEWHTLVAQQPLGPHDALLDGWLRDEEGPGDLVGGQ